MGRNTLDATFGAFDINDFACDAKRKPKNKWYSLQIYKPLSLVSK